MNKQKFDEVYDLDIPKGVFKQVRITEAQKMGYPEHHDTSHDLSCVTEDGRLLRVGSFKHAFYAGYVEDLINAYQSGKLVWVDDVEPEGDK